MSKKNKFCSSADVLKALETNDFDDEDLSEFDDRDGDEPVRTDVIIADELQ